jgi:hypothetical protein
MEKKMNTSGTDPNEPMALTAMDEILEHPGAVPPNAPPKTVERARWWFRLGAVWRFTRHLLEMIVAMMAGMAVLGVTLGVLGEPPGYANVLVEYGLMGTAMATPMVAWMRYRGHTWWDGLEMTVAMLVPMFALVLPVALGVARYVPGLSEQSLMMLSHVAMVAGMVVLMIYRRDTYAHGALRTSG